LALFSQLSSKALPKSLYVSPSDGGEPFGETENQYNNLGTNYDNLLNAAEVRSCHQIPYCK
jgi:hypothetical protein